MGGAACIIIINGNKAYGIVEDLAEKYSQVNTNNLEAAINTSCSIIPYVSLFLQHEGSYIETIYTQPIIDLHNRIIVELPLISRQEAQKLVDELTELLFAASEQVANVIEDEVAD